MFRNVPKGSDRFRNVPMFRKVPKGSEKFRKVHNGFERFCKVLQGSERFRKVRKGSKRSQMVPKRYLKAINCATMQNSFITIFVLLFSFRSFTIGNYKTKRNQGGRRELRNRKYWQNWVNSASGRRRRRETEMQILIAQ